MLASWGLAIAFVIFVLMLAYQIRSLAVQQMKDAAKKRDEERQERGQDSDVDEDSLGPIKRTAVLYDQDAEERRGESGERRDDSHQVQRDQHPSRTLSSSVSQTDLDDEREHQHREYLGEQARSGDVYSHAGTLPARRAPFGVQVVVRGCVAGCCATLAFLALGYASTPTAIGLWLIVTLIGARALRQQRPVTASPAPHGSTPR